MDGPPFASATGLKDASEADTVFWYKGDLTGTPGKNMLAQIDDGRQLAYGARADQAAIRDTLKMSALLSAVTYTGQSCDRAWPHSGDTWQHTKPARPDDGHGE